MILVEGRFNLPELRKATLAQKATLQRYRGVEIIKAPAGSREEMDLAVLSSRTILAGDRASLLAAIERIQAGPVEIPATATFRRAIALSAKSDIWGVASPEVFSAMGLKELSTQVRIAAGGDPVAAQFLKALKGIEAGGPIEFGFTIDELQKSAPKLAHAPVPVEKRRIRIYGLDDGVKELEFKD